MAKFREGFIYGLPISAECAILYREALVPFISLSLKLQLVGLCISSLVKRQPGLHGPNKQYNRIRFPGLPVAPNPLSSFVLRGASRPIHTNHYAAAMTPCKRLLAAYACAYLSGPQVPMTSTPTVNATLIGAAGAQYSIPILVDMSLVYTSKGSGVSNSSEDKTNLRPDNVLSISHVETTGGTCTFCGVDGAEVVTNCPGPGLYQFEGRGGCWTTVDDCFCCLYIKLISHKTLTACMETLMGNR